MAGTKLASPIAGAAMKGIGSFIFGGGGGAAGVGGGAAAAEGGGGGALLLGGLGAAGLTLGGGLLGSLAMMGKFFTSDTVARGFDVASIGEERAGELSAADAKARAGAAGAMSPGMREAYEAERLRLSDRESRRRGIDPGDVFGGIMDHLAPGAVAGIKTTVSKTELPPMLAAARDHLLPAAAAAVPKASSGAAVQMAAMVDQLVKAGASLQLAQESAAKLIGTREIQPIQIEVINATGGDIDAQVRGEQRAVARKNLLTGSQIASFTPDGGDTFELHESLQVITDSRGPRVVVHEFPNRDGAKVETLGRRPHKTEWQLTFVGVTWLTQLTTLVAAIDASPGGLLVHPIYGQMRVVCQGFDRSVLDIVNATDTVTLPLVFIEDQVDLTLADQQGLAALQQQVSTSIDDFNAELGSYNDTGTLSAGSTLSSNASSYADAAFTAASTNNVDPSLGAQLGSVGSALSSFEAAIAQDSTAAQSIAQSYNVLAAAEVIYMACLDLADEVAFVTSGATEYVVPGLTSIAVLAAARYQQRAISVLDEILRLNADVIDDPTAIPEGTRLILPP
jgi:hypothetical protein